jgi:hypothetical protein
MHPDSRSITVVKDSRIVSAFYDNGTAQNNKDGGNVFQSKNVPHFTLFYDSIGDIAVGDLLQNSSGKQYKVTEIKRDKTEETYQGELVCVEVK